MKKICLIISVLLLVSGCASKRFTKQAAKFEQAGLFEDAAEYYYEAVKRKDSNVEAKLGLRKNGQITLDNKLSAFMKAYNGADFQDAVYKYKDAESYSNKLKTVGVDLNFPESYESYYDEAKGDFLNKKYADGLEKLNREDFSGAYMVFEEILGIDPNYKDVKEKNTIARYEPAYRQANQFLEIGLYRKAYYKFNEILTGAGKYKQAAILKEEALEKGTLAILVINFTFSNYENRDVANTISAKVKGQLGKLPNPFIKVIDQSTVDQTIFEKGTLNMQAANLKGITAVLSGNLVEISKTEGKLNKTTKKGYLKEVIKTSDESGHVVETVNWHKTEYNEFDMENSAKLSMSFKMVSTYDGEVLTSDNFSLIRSDRLHYAKFEGEKKNLVPGYWKYKIFDSSEDIIKNNPKDINALKQLLDAKQTIKTTTSLVEEAIDQAADKISQSVDKYNPEEK